jgi:hypothetical protein
MPVSSDHYATKSRRRNTLTGMSAASPIAQPIKNTSPNAFAGHPSPWIPLFGEMAPEIPSTETLPKELESSTDTATASFPAGPSIRSRRFFHYWYTLTFFTTYFSQVFTDGYKNNRAKDNGVTLKNTLFFEIPSPYRVSLHVEIFPGHPRSCCGFSCIHCLFFTRHPRNPEGCLPRRGQENRKQRFPSAP